MRAAVISDTHDLLRQEVTDIMESCDVIIHAGDVNTQKLAEQLEKKKPLYLVRGNNDGEWASGLPETLWFELEGVSFYMIHNKREIPEVRREADVIIYGHTHNYDCQKEGNTLWLNPGSCGKRRFSLPITMRSWNSITAAMRWSGLICRWRKRARLTGKTPIWRRYTLWREAWRSKES